ncbi:cytochrome c-type biogenesis protein CcmH [Alcanivorax sp. VBW004]|jgi:cytochrome c-type biogenesis protein CcmH|uniref:cytochrome c-type biogenesis protein n=1 Tax=unclassified Alcanivorax TaxID=2638842 RepID=UPI00017EB968|nr:MULTISPECIES: cytochrome c-type biogenesis protein [unclassified Alcanivorax]EDX88978.1 Cytochrome C biogenesis protein [Alcanivorax sp. DG881]MTT52722.1 cytochrome c-type biogenesis protein CcmH [Alcanivorax sp. VBW004]HIL23306.1 cytochrome c-type biogenesis protein CcmH [Alcanivorax sp.]
MLRIVLLLMLSMPAFAAIDVYQFDNEQQEQRFRILSEELRCPKCQNQSIADSDAGIAQDMRTRVHTMILEGKSDEDIVDYFVSRYGDFVSYRPPVNAGTSILWLGPILLLLGGAVLIVILLRNASRKAAADDEASQDKEPEEGTK